METENVASGEEISDPLLCFQRKKGLTLEAVYNFLENSLQFSRKLIFQFYCFLKIVNYYYNYYYLD